MIHPWRDLDHGVRVEIRRLPDHLYGYCVPSQRLIVLAKGLLQTERRSTLVHESIHMQRGDHETCTPKEERRIDQAAAHRLIDIEALGDALVAHSDNDWSGVAWELWVDEATLRTRLDHLHPSERHYLRRRLAARDDTEGGA